MHNFKKHGALLLAITAVLSGCAVKKLTNEVGNPKWGLEITYNGHSCFTLRDSVGRTVVIDPYDETVGFGRLNVRADALLISHPHFDHNYKRGVRPRFGEFDMTESSGTVSVAEGMYVTGIPSFHDNENGEINGPNLIHVFVMGGLRCVHMGDYGEHQLTDYQRKLIGTVDVLFVPVGGITTIDGPEAKSVVDQLKPKAIIPMHYGNMRFFKFNELSTFTSLFPPTSVVDVKSDRIRLKSMDLTDTPIVYILTSVPQK